MPSFSSRAAAFIPYWMYPDTLSRYQGVAMWLSIQFAAIFASRFLQRPTVLLLVPQGVPY
ncbi:hypothetical protein BJF89_13770 [Corynebacterium sp. CNJ-954]|nr:hypothetical protein BJF89_13770 [Corynebacterium sp. CNJ-954]